MTDRSFFVCAVGLYGLAALHSLFLWRKGFRRDDWVNYGVLLGAFLLHVVAMIKRGFSLERCPVNNLYEVLTFVSWSVAGACLVAGLWRKLRFLGAFAAPVLFGIGVFALMPGMDPPHHGRPQFQADWASLHAGLILLACGAFGLGSVAASMYLKEEHDLKYNRSRAILSLLPPIQRLDRLTTGLVLAGLALLTAGLALSPWLIRQRPGGMSGADPILVYSGLIWLIYLVLLVRRWWFGQAGRRFAWGAVGSFVFLLLTFWGIILLSPSHAP